MTTMLGRPPVVPLGHRLSLTFEVQFRDTRRRDRETVSDVAGRWVVRYVKRAWAGYRVEGWSPDVYPGQTYRDWWFGSVEVYVVRTVAA